MRLERRSLRGKKDDALLAAALDYARRGGLVGSKVKKTLMQLL